MVNENYQYYIQVYYTIYLNDVLELDKALKLDEIYDGYLCKTFLKKLILFKFAVSKS